MLAHPVAPIARDDYLRTERQAEFRSEYIDGEIFAMAGASRDHNRILTNISTSLDNQLKHRECNVYSSDMKVSIQSGRRYLYPDCVATCGNEEFEDEERDVLLNPILILEVLSPSTEAFDRGAKFFYYQTIESLREYVLVSQTSRRIEVYSRQSEGSWVYTSMHTTPGEITLGSVTCVLRSVDIYDKVIEEIK